MSLTNKSEIFSPLLKKLIPQLPPICHMFEELARSIKQLFLPVLPSYNGGYLNRFHDYDVSAMLHVYMHFMIPAAKYGGLVSLLPPARRQGVDLLRYMERVQRMTIHFYRLLSVKFCLPLTETIKSVDNYRNL